MSMNITHKWHSLIDKTIIIAYVCLIFIMWLLKNMFVVQVGFISIITLFLPISLIVYYSVTSGKVLHSIVIFLCLTIFVGAMMQITHFSGSNLVTGIGVIPNIFLSGLVSYSIFYNTSNRQYIKYGGIGVSLLIFGNLLWPGFSTMITNIPSGKLFTTLSSYLILILLIYLTFDQKHISFKKEIKIA